jgi:hypothetical protein
MGSRAKLGNLSRMSNIAQTAIRARDTLVSTREGVTFNDSATANWQELAAQASKELDPVRLMSLVDELNRALEQNEQTSMRLQTKFV